jgi:hypothetical protein
VCSSNAFRLSENERYQAQSGNRIGHQICALVAAHGPFDECLKSVHVHIRDLLDAKTSLACRVLAEFGEQRFGAIKVYRAVQNVCGASESASRWGTDFGFRPALCSRGGNDDAAECQKKARINSA